MFLRELGHQLLGRCSNGLEAIQMCHTLKPDVVLMDIHLEGELDGIQTAERLMRELAVPVIYISSDTSRTVIKRAIVSNSYGYLVKPINKKELGISIDLAFYKHKVDIEQKEREQGYRQFINEAPMPIIVIQNGNIQYLNKWALEVFKTHYIEDLLATPFLNYVEVKSINRANSLLKEFELTGFGFENIKVNMLDIHGQKIYTKLSGSSIVFNGQKSLQVTVVESVPLDYRIHLDEMKAMLDKTGVAYVVVDKDMVVVDHSKHPAFKGVKLIGIDVLKNEQCVFVESDGSEEPSLQLTNLSHLPIKFLGKKFRNEMGEVAATLFYAIVS